MADGLDTANIDSNSGDRKTRRAYDSSLRREQAARTHATVLDAGHRLFLARGYARTTMRDIATEAGVAVDSVYGHFRSKSALLSALMDRTHGADDDLAVADREWVRDVRGRPEVSEQLGVLATNLTEVYRTLAPLHLAVRRAADADTTAARIWQERSADRLAGLERFAARVVASGALDGALDSTLDEATVRDILYAMTSPEMYGLLVLDRGWEPERYSRWLASTLRAQLGVPTGA